MTVAVSPDTGEVLRTWAASRTAITTITGTRIAVTLTGPLPAIRYALLSLRDVGAGAVVARYQVECWGTGGNAPDDGTSDLLARKVLSEVDTMNGTIGSARVAGAAVTSVTRQDDTTTGRPRNIIDLTFIASP